MKNILTYENFDSTKKVENQEDDEEMTSESPKDKLSREIEMVDKYEEFMKKQRKEE